MSHTPHELAEEFPDKVDVMSALKGSDAHFAKLSDEYHALKRRAFNLTHIRLHGSSSSIRLV